MQKQEKEILKKVVESHQGLLSPSEFLNGTCQGNHKLGHNLIALGFIEEVPHKVHGRDCTFYRATEKGFAVFLSSAKKIWYAIRSDIRTIVISVITSLLITFLTLWLTGEFVS